MRREIVRFRSIDDRNLQRAGRPDKRALEGAGGAPPLHVEDGGEVEGAWAGVG